MHYAQYKHQDPALVGEILKTFPFAAILVNGVKWPAVAQAPMTFRNGATAAGAVEFHLAIANPIAGDLVRGAPITIHVHGFGTSISPAWYTASFPTPSSDRSRTAPTYSYLSLVLNGHLEHMDDKALQAQIATLVHEFESVKGWRLDELAPELWGPWRSAIQGYRMEIESFDITAKIDHGDTVGDKVGISAGLRKRSVLDDRVIARFVDEYDGSPASLTALLREFRLHHSPP